MPNSMRIFFVVCMGMLTEAPFKQPMEFEKYCQPNSYGKDVAETSNQRFIVCVSVVIHDDKEVEKTHWWLM